MPFPCFPCVRSAVPRDLGEATRRVVMPGPINPRHGHRGHLVPLTQYVTSQVH